jgi:cephalosporin-C deacetylase
MDTVCPPSSVFAAHNAYGGSKRIQVWPYNGHENGMGYLRELHLEFANSLAKPEAVAVG